jgi:penicillin-binding protein 1A
MGFDEKVTLGDKETGGLAALPMWLEMMQQIYKDKPIEQFETAPSQTTSAPQEKPSAAVTTTPHPVSDAIVSAPTPIDTDTERLTQ